MTLPLAPPAVFAPEVSYETARMWTTKSSALIAANLRRPRLLRSGWYLDEVCKTDLTSSPVRRAG
jgi:hypothetical protein